MSRANVGRLFYCGDSDFAIANKTVKNIYNLETNESCINNLEYEKYFKVDNSFSFNLRTTPPGLLIGTGYIRATEQSKDEYKTGFFFDHTTGFPYLPGSTVKGILKSAFPKVDDNLKTEKPKWLKEKLEFINMIVKVISPASVEITEKNWDEIFFKGHCFFDAYINNFSGSDILFEDDILTPHTGGLLKNPEPIKMLKIRPEVKFTFQFFIADKSEYNLTKENIAQIFRLLLIETGIGAKRNVGYGALTN